MDLWGFLTKALFLKPKRTTEGWEHKNGFYVPLKDAKAAFSIIENARNKRRYSSLKKRNVYQGMNRERLREIAEIKLCEIQASSNNYIEAICAIGGLATVIYLLDLLVLIWSYPKQETVRLFLVLIAVLGLLIFLYFKKQKIDKNNVETFLDVEDALFQIEYGESQYKN